MTTAKTESTLIADNSFVVLKIAQKQVKASYQKHLKKMAVKVKTAGFRQGKVPLTIAEGVIGQNKIIDQVLQELVPPAYTQALKQEQKKPLSQPRFEPVNLSLETDFELKAYFAEAPIIDLKDYQKIVKEAKKQAQEELKKAAKTATETKTETKNQPAAKSQDKNQSLTDEQKKDLTMQLIFKRLITQIKPAIAQLLVEEQTQQELEQFSRQLSNMNLTLDKYLQAKQIQPEELSRQLAASALGKLQLDFILNNIAQQEKLIATAQDIEQKIKDIKQPGLAEKVKKDQYYQQYLNSIIVRQKTIDYLYQL